MDYQTILTTIQKYLKDNESSYRFVHFKKQPWFSAYKELYTQMGLPNVKTERNRFYLFERNLTSEPQCKMCSNTLRWFPNFGKYATTYCSDKCQKIDPDYKTSRSIFMQAKWDNATKQEKEEHKVNTLAGLCNAYGVDNMEEYKKARQEEWIYDAIVFLKEKELYVDGMSIDDIKSKWGRYFGDILLNKSEEEKQATLDRRFETNMERYGSIGVLGDETIQERYKATNLDRHGVEYVLQNPNIFEKAYLKRCKKKEYKLPTGDIVMVQGYEPWALDKLLPDYEVSDLRIADANFNITWNDISGRTRRFFPDIYIKSENRIVEVKSTYTWEKDEEINWQKKQACIEQGFNCEFWVFDGKGNLEVK